MRSNAGITPPPHSKTNIELNKFINPQGSMVGIVSDYQSVKIESTIVGDTVKSEISLDLEEQADMCKHEKDYLAK